MNTDGFAAKRRKILILGTRSVKASTCDFKMEFRVLRSCCSNLEPEILPRLSGQSLRSLRSLRLINLYFSVFKKLALTRLSPVVACPWSKNPRFIMMHAFRTWRVALALTATGLLLSACSASKPTAPDGPFILYSVSGGTVSIVVAVTPYDGQPGARDVFLHWFKRGFENALAGRPPLMIEWDTTPEAAAGRRGYDFGSAEAEHYLKNGKPPGSSPITAPIPPG